MSVREKRCRASHLIAIRLVYLVHAHDGAETQGYEGERQASAKGRIITSEHNHHRGVGWARALKKVEISGPSIYIEFSSFRARSIPLRVTCTTSCRNTTLLNTPPRTFLLMSCSASYVRSGTALPLTSSHILLRRSWNPRSQVGN